MDDGRKEMTSEGGKVAHRTPVLDGASKGSMICLIQSPD